MTGRLFMRLYAAAIVLASLAGTVYVYAAPPASLRATRDGVPHFTPPAAHPQTGEALDLGMLVRHYKGVK